MCISCTLSLLIIVYHRKAPASGLCVCVCLARNKYVVIRKHRQNIKRDIFRHCVVSNPYSCMW